VPVTMGSMAFAAGQTAIIIPVGAAEPIVGRWHSFECRLVPGGVGFAQNCGARYEPAVGCWSPAYTTWTTGSVGVEIASAHA
jgi:hypothetical protein